LSGSSGAVASVNVCVTVNAGTTIKLVFITRSRSIERMERGIGFREVTSRLNIVAILAKLRKFPLKKSAMAAAVSLVAVQTVFFHRRMFPHKGTSFFGVAFIA